MAGAQVTLNFKIVADEENQLALEFTKTKIDAGQYSLSLLSETDIGKAMEGLLR